MQVPNLPRALDDVLLSGFLTTCCALAVTVFNCENTINQEIFLHRHFSLPGESLHVVITDLSVSRSDNFFSESNILYNLWFFPNLASFGLVLCSLSLKKQRLVCPGLKRKTSVSTKHKVHFTKQASLQQSSY